jgi:hypothetical protein
MWWGWWLGLCACDWLPQPPSDAPAAREPLVVRISVWCVDLPCTTVGATSVTESGEAVAWLWTLDGVEVGQTEEIVLPAREGVAALELVATPDSGVEATAAGALSVDTVDVYAAEHEAPTSDGRVVFVPFTDCDDIPVVNIGGCVTGSADPLNVDILAMEAHHVHWSAAGALAQSPDAYTSDQPDPHAAWRIGAPPVVGVAPGTGPEEYGYPGFPVPAPPAEHFTFYFDGPLEGTAVLQISHGSPWAKVYSRNEVVIVCTEGQVDEVVHRPVDRGSLDHDGDGFPASRDCDETDPMRYEGRGC